jgi:hypothetical protein
MKKVLSTIVAAIVAVSFAGMVFAAEPATSETKTSTETSSTAPGVEKKSETTVKKSTKKTKKGKKTRKVKKVIKKEETTTEPAPAAK